MMVFSIHQLLGANIMFAPLYLTRMKNAIISNIKATNQRIRPIPKMLFTSLAFYYIAKGRHFGISPYNT